jgi:hypothetical protein
MGRMVTPTVEITAFERATDPLLRLLTREQAEQFVAWQGDDSLRSRIDQLAERNSEGELTADELAEYEGYVRANKFIAILQTKARKLLVQGN